VAVAAPATLDAGTDPPVDVPLHTDPDPDPPEDVQVLVV